MILLAGVWELITEIQTTYKFTCSDAGMIVGQIYHQHQWVNYNDLKLQVFRFAQRLKNGGF